jgi:CP family cyanate transporter-like MFS transporter
VALTLIVLRSPTPLVAARLGGVAQCLGYPVAAAGPLLFGALHDLTGGWRWPVAALIALLVPMTWVGWGAARNTVVSVEEERSPVAA